MQQAEWDLHRVERCRSLSYFDSFVVKQFERKELKHEEVVMIR